MPAWTRAGLRATGMDEASLYRAVRRGELVRVGRDRYSVPGQDADDALVAAVGSGVALRSLSAVRVWGLPGGDGHIEAQVRNGCRRPALPRGVTLRTARRWQVVEHAGLLVTDLAQTCADVAREQPLEVSVPVIDAALRGGLERADIEARLGRGDVGAGQARRALELSDGRAESPLESRLRLLLTLAGLPPHDLQHVVYGRDGVFIGRVDLWYPGVVVEADGYEFHGSRDDFRRDLAKGVEYARRGLLVQRFSWEQVVGQPRRVFDAVTDAVSSALAEAPQAAVPSRKQRHRSRTASAGGAGRRAPARQGGDVGAPI